jgi:hypothetical protein
MRTAFSIRRYFQTCVVVVLPVIGAMNEIQACATQVWNGTNMEFNLPGGADWTQPTNQDRITTNVWITRDAVNGHGIFNAASESVYASHFSPKGTEWAYGFLTNYASLSYTNWEDCYGSAPVLINNITSTNVVVHLIADDIYLSLKFTSWGGPGAGFTYTRSTPPQAAPPPAVTLNALLVGTNFQLSFLSVAGHTHTVQSRTNPDSGVWETRTNVTGDDSLKTLRFPIQPTGSEFFDLITN